MSEWNHSICVGCWNEKNPDRKTEEPHYGHHPPENPQKFCCYCEAETHAGIYVRDDPENCIYGGKHDKSGEEKFPCPSCGGYFIDEKITNNGECISCRMTSKD